MCPCPAELVLCPEDLRVCIDLLGGGYLTSEECPAGQSFNCGGVVPSSPARVVSAAAKGAASRSAAASTAAAAMGRTPDQATPRVSASRRKSSSSRTRSSWHYASNTEASGLRWSS